MILEYRGLAKLRSTYTDKLPDMVNPNTGRVHTSYHQAGAATGRLASSRSEPAEHPDPHRRRPPHPPGVRRAGRPHASSRCDYSQIELRIMAHLSEDPSLLHAFGSGADIHRATAAEVFGKAMDEVTGNERRAAKAINFGLMYGMSAFGLARAARHRAAARRRITSRCTSAAIPACATTWSARAQQAREKGYVETVFGRRLYLENIHARNQGLRAGAERAAINAPMQGTAADIIKRAMIEIDRWLANVDGRALMLLQVHDELVFEADTGFVDDLIAGATARMAAAAELRVPLLVDAGTGANWDEAH